MNVIIKRTTLYREKGLCFTMPTILWFFIAFVLASLIIAIISNIVINYRLKNDIKTYGIDKTTRALYSSIPSLSLSI